MKNKEDHSPILSLTATTDEGTEFDTSNDRDTISTQTFPNDSDRDQPLFWYPAEYDPRDTDVVCGRTNHPNIRFNHLIQENTNEYDHARHCKVRKNNLVSKIYDQLTFIKFDENARRYQKLCSSRARAKVALAFRLSLAQRDKDRSQGRLPHRRRERLMPTDFVPQDTDVIILDEKGSSNVGRKLLEFRIQELLTIFLARRMSEQKALVTRLYRELRDQGRLFFHRRARENYQWHQMSQYTSTVAIYKLFQNEIDSQKSGEIDRCLVGRSDDSAATSVSSSTKSAGTNKETPHNGEENILLMCPESKDDANVAVQAWQVDVRSQDKQREDTFESADYMTTLHLQESCELDPQTRKLQLKAKELLQGVCSQGEADAKFTLAQCLHDGIGMEKNLEKAVNLYCLAAAQFHVNKGNGELPDGFLTSQANMFSHHAMWSHPV